MRSGHRALRRSRRPAGHRMTSPPRAWVPVPSWISPACRRPADQMRKAIMVAASTTVASDEEPQPGLGRSGESPGVQRLPAPVGALELAANRDHPASHVPHVAREHALGEREQHRKDRGEHGDASDVARHGRVATEHGEAAPRQPEPEVRMEPPPASSRLYASTRKIPMGMSSPSQASKVTAPATPIMQAPRIETPASATRIRSGIFVRSGRPFSSSRAWAPTPTARANAATAAPSRPQAPTGASRSQAPAGARQPPMTTYDRCQAV